VNVTVGLRVAAVSLIALVAGCSTDTGGHAAPSAVHSPSARAASATSGRHGHQTGLATAGPAATSPAVQCANHLKMALIMTDPAQPVRAQVATFTAGTGLAPPWEVAAFQNVVTRFSSVVAKNGRHAALQRPAFGYSALLQLCSQSAAE
jgi:hypothetical protein